MQLNITNCKHWSEATDLLEVLSEDNNILGVLLAAMNGKLGADNVVLRADGRKMSVMHDGEYCDETKSALRLLISQSAKDEEKLLLRNDAVVITYDADEKTIVLEFETTASEGEEEKKPADSKTAPGIRKPVSEEQTAEAVLSEEDVYLVLDKFSRGPFLSWDGYARFAFGKDAAKELKDELWEKGYHPIIIEVSVKDRPYSLIHLFCYCGAEGILIRKRSGSILTDTVVRKDAVMPLLDDCTSEGHYKNAPRNPSLMRSLMTYCQEHKTKEFKAPRKEDKNDLFVCCKEELKNSILLMPVCDEPKCLGGGTCIMPAGKKVAIPTMGKVEDHDTVALFTNIIEFEKKYSDNDQVSGVLEVDLEDILSLPADNFVINPRGIDLKLSKNILKEIAMEH